MTFPNSCLFAKTAAECRAVGARGGRARARNLRLCRPTTPPPPASPEHEPEGTHEASLMLDEQFPHLRDAFGPRRTKRAAIIELLRRDEGASIDEIARVTGWDRRSSQSFRTAIGSGHMVASYPRADGTRAFRIAS